MDGEEDRDRLRRPFVRLPEPSYIQLEADAMRRAHLLDPLSQTDRTLSPKLIFLLGQSRVYRECARFFDAMTVLQRGSQFGRAGLATVGGVAAGIMGLARASAEMIAITASGLTAADTLGRNIEDMLLLTPYAATLQPLVLGRMQTEGAALLASVPDSGSDKDQQNANRIIAMQLLAQYARHCTVSTIIAEVNSSIVRSASEDFAVRGLLTAAASALSEDAATGDWARLYRLLPASETATITAPSNASEGLKRLITAYNGRDGRRRKQVQESLRLAYTTSATFRSAVDQRPAS